MVKTKKTLIKRNLIRGSLFAALLGTVALPSTANAGDDDPDCGESVIALEVDTTTGDVYILNGTGAPILTDNEINVYFGSVSRVTIDIQYSDAEWEVEVTPDNDPSDQYLTRGGALRFSIEDSYAEYVIESDEFGSASMAPIPPVVIKPDPDCPPET